MAGIKDVAKMAGVGVGTVSRMLTVNKHKLTVKRMSDLLPASFLYGIIQDKIV